MAVATHWHQTNSQYLPCSVAAFCTVGVSRLFTRKQNLLRTVHTAFPSNSCVVPPCRPRSAKYYASGILPEETKVNSRLPPITGSEDDKSPKQKEQISVITWLERGAWIGLACLILIECCVHIFVVKDWLPRSS